MEAYLTLRGGPLLRHHRLLRRFPRAGGACLRERHHPYGGAGGVHHPGPMAAKSATAHLPVAGGKACGAQ